MADLDSLTVTHVATGQTFQNKVISIDPLTQPVAPEIAIAVMVLDAEDGAFLTNSNSGATPIMDQFAKIRIQGTDSNGNTYDEIFEVDYVLPTLTGNGYRAELHLHHPAHWLNEIHFGLQFIRPNFVDAYTAFKTIGQMYNENKGTAQPTMEGHESTTTNTLPSWTSHEYDFGNLERYCLDGMVEVQDKQGASVDNLGAGNFWETVFTKHPSDSTKFLVENFISGSKPASPVTIVGTTTLDLERAEGRIEAQRGSVVHMRGADDYGTLPIDYAYFRSGEEVFNNHPVHVVGTTYLTGAKIQKDGIHYKALSNTSTTPPGAAWTVITPSTSGEYGATYTYSPWTKNKAALWKNAGADPSGSFFGRGCYDGNKVVVDGTRFRVPVDVRCTNIALHIPAQYLYGGSSYYRGLRILVDTALGSPVGALALNGGKDRFGKSYAGNVVIHNGGTEIASDAYKNWDVLYVMSTSNLVAVDHESRVYEKGGGTAYTNVSSTSSKNECYHQYEDITNDQGVHTTFGSNSAVKVRYKLERSIVSLFGDQILSLNNNYYKYGAWLNFKFPFPYNTYNGISEAVGQLYGGSNSSPVPREPVTLDTYNMTMTPDGKRGFGNGLSSEALGPLSALSFDIKFFFNLISFGLPLDPHQGNFKFRCICRDISDNLVKQDFVVPFNNIWELGIQLPLTAFEPYRARAPLVYGLDAAIPVQQLKVLNIFDWKNIKEIVIQNQEVYEGEGRYHPAQSRFYQIVNTNTIVDYGTLDLWIDSFKFIKTLYVNTGTGTSQAYNIEPPFLERPYITNVFQLKNDAYFELEKAQFRRKTFTIAGTPGFLTSPGHSVYFQDANLVSDSDNGAGTIKVVVKKIIHHITKPAGGPGGFRTEYEVAKRFQ